MASSSVVLSLRPSLLHSTLTSLTRHDRFLNLLNCNHAKLLLERSSLIQQHRSFAYGTNWKVAPKRKKKPSRSKLNNRESRIVFERNEETIIPPTLLLPTGSEHVYHSLYSAQLQNFDPRQLFRPEYLRRLVRPTCRYHGTSCPSSLLSEVAVLGRSNVGKSSLLNALTGCKKALLRVSKQPGRTQHGHYVECATCESHSDSSMVVVDNNKERNNIHSEPIGYLLDLPGYGYAVGPDEAVESWQRRTQNLLMRRRDEGALKRIYLLVDGRHGASTLDNSIMGWLEEGEFPFTVVLTKSDAVGLPMIVKHANHLCMRYHHEASLALKTEVSLMMSPLVHVTSAKNGTGLVELWASILRDFRS